jgi:signal transduction histidine kinase
MLDDLGLTAAVDWYLRSVSKRYDLRAEFQCDGMEVRLAVETEVAAFRIVQEALTNVVKHARATSCRVALRRHDQRLDLTIEDDGIGFDLPGAESRERRGLGLVGIRERVAQLRGTLRVERGVAAGARIVVELPARARITIEPIDGDVAVAPTAPPIAQSPPSLGLTESQPNHVFARRGGHG